MTAVATTAKRLRCPSCNNDAKRVSPITLRALLKDQFATQIASDEHSCCDSTSNGCTPITDNTGWRFCDSRGCDVVYFSEDSDVSFTKPQLTVPVGVKETEGERPLCYCFGHSVASIKDELRTKRESDALDDIRAKMNDPGCHCETANPGGSCCLGSVTRGIDIARTELESHDTDLSPPSTSKSTTGRGEKIAKIGTVLSAIMASSCCWLPLLMLAVGVSSAGIASTLEAYRPLFIVATFGFLGAAFYFTYRPKKPADNCCGTEPTGKDCRAPTRQRPLTMMTLNKVMLWAVTVLAVAFLFFPSYVGVLFGTGDEKVVTSDMNRAVIKIEGMTCEGCAATVAQAIRQVPSVSAVEVSYEKRQAVVGTAASRPVPTDKILAALEDAGYTGRVEAREAAKPAGTKQEPQPDEGSTSLIDLSPDGHELKAAFNAAEGNVRLILIVSPG